MPSKILFTMKWLEEQREKEGVHKNEVIIPRDDDEQNGHVDPAEQPELLLEVTTLERYHEANEAEGV